MWATMKALIDHNVVPRREAIGMAKRLTSWTMTEFAPLVDKWLAREAT